MEEVLIETMLKNRNSNITTQLAHIINTFSDFRLVAQIKKEIERMKMDYNYPPKL